MPDRFTPSEHSELKSRILPWRWLLWGALLAAEGWACMALNEPEKMPAVITMKLDNSCPLSDYYFPSMALFLVRNHGPDKSTRWRLPPHISEPGLRVWKLDPEAYAGCTLDLRDDSELPVPRKREVLHVEYDTFIRQGGRADLTVGGNVIRASFGFPDRKLGVMDRWQHDLTSALLLAPETSPDAHGTPWRLVEHSVIIKDCTCQFTLISPGDYRVQLLNSTDAVMLTGRLHVPGDFKRIQNLEVLLEDP